ncbi:Gfo/Idh/MocA family protein [Halapricum desulfuricans]|uniref:Putative dehydrogenase n=1 Tax=Halapricum desulfuricans TaxID=2841257 RepID=A0A897N2N8_9EURY|nr:Gfo/Idh/MocA family oxidoreductase [Halapricum desulfuricans]QSG06488.1 putative dehydrogenase [Halapricum desulfuricans]
MATTSTTPRVGIVGLGGIGTYHADLVAENDARLVAGLDVDPSARTRFETEYGAETYTDRTSFYDAVDAVIVTTPNAYHEKYAVGALQAGCSVLVEKPLAHTLESAERIAAAAAESDAVCMVGFHNRFDPRAEALAAYREDGFFGTVQHVDATYVRRRGVPGQGTWFTDADVAGGGALIDIGVHALDLVLSLLAFPDVEEVSGVARSTFGQREDYVDVEGWGGDDGTVSVEDSATAQLRTADDATISLDVAWAANRTDETAFRLRGTDGGAYLDMNGDLTLYESVDHGVDQHRTTTVETAEYDGHAAEQQAFFEAVTAGEDPDRNTVEQALTVQRLVEAIYRSSDDGAAVAPQ